MAELLIIGRAIDGPSHQAIRTNNVQDLVELFSWNEERVTVTPTASSFMLDYNPFDSVSFNVLGVGPILYQPYTAQSSVFFGPIGYSSGNYEIDCKYRTYLGKDDLVAAASNSLLNGNLVPTLCRIKGETATCTIGDWVFSAQYCGAKYNNMSITSTATSITFSGMFPRYSSQTFITTGDSTQLVTDINTYNALGIIPFYVKLNSGAIPSSGLVNFTGGTDGEINSSTLREALEMCVTTDTTQVLILAEATSSLISTVIDFFELYDLQPRTFVFPAPALTGEVSSYITGLPTTLPERSKWINLILGESTVDLDTNQHQRWNAENATIAYQGTYLTNKPIRVVNLNPVLTESELESLYQSGVMAPVRKIGSGISIYKACVSSADFKYPYAQGVARACAISYGLLNRYFGAFIGPGRNSKIENELLTALRNGGVDAIECIVDIIDDVGQFQNTREGISIIYGKHLNCQLTIRIFDEILAFNFVVKNK